MSHERSALCRWRNVCFKSKPFCNILFRLPGAPVISVGSQISFISSFHLFSTYSLESSTYTTGRLTCRRFCNMKLRWHKMTVSLIFIVRTQYSSEIFSAHVTSFRCIGSLLLFMIVEKKFLKKKISFNNLYITFRNPTFRLLQFMKSLTHISSSSSDHWIGYKKWLKNLSLLLHSTWLAPWRLTHVRFILNYIFFINLKIILRSCHQYTRHLLLFFWEYLYHFSY